MSHKVSQRELWKITEGFFHCGGLSQVSYLRHGVSTRGFGNAKDLEVRRRVARYLGAESDRLVRGHQVHGCRIQQVHESDAGTCFDGTDALITNAPGIPLAVLTADCQAVFIVDPVKRAIALVHAGWRGLDQRIITKTVEQLSCCYRSESADLMVAIGPHIGPCCYLVKQDVAGKFPEACERVGDDQFRLNMAQVSVNELQRRGISQDKIFVAPFCTNETTDCYSCRREPSHFGQMMSVLEIMR